jgi:hypothetical protein
MSTDNNSKNIAFEKIQKYMEKMYNPQITGEKKQLYSKKLKQWFKVMVGGGCFESYEQNKFYGLIRDPNITIPEKEKYIKFYCSNNIFNNRIDTLFDAGGINDDTHHIFEQALEIINRDRDRTVFIIPKHLHTLIIAHLRIRQLPPPRPNQPHPEPAYVDMNQVENERRQRELTQHEKRRLTANQTQLRPGQYIPGPLNEQPYAVPKSKFVR